MHRSAVNSQLRGRNEFLIAFLAFVDPTFTVAVHVADKYVPFRKLEAAYITFIRLIVSMRFHVGVIVVLQCKQLSTRLALERFPTNMCSHMIAKIAVPREGFPAKVTLETFLNRM